MKREQSNLKQKGRQWQEQGNHDLAGQCFSQRQGVVVHAFDLSTWGAEAVVSVGLRLAWSIQ